MILDGAMSWKYESNLEEHVKMLTIIKMLIINSGI